MFSLFKLRNYWQDLKNNCMRLEWSNDVFAPVKIYSLISRQSVQRWWTKPELSEKTTELWASKLINLETLGFEFDSWMWDAVRGSDPKKCMHKTT